MTLTPKPTNSIKTPKLDAYSRAVATIMTHCLATSKKQLLLFIQLLAFTETPIQQWLAMPILSESLCDLGLISIGSSWLSPLLLR